MNVGVVYEFGIALCLLVGMYEFMCNSNFLISFSHDINTPDGAILQELEGTLIFFTNNLKTNMA